MKRPIPYQEPAGEQAALDCQAWREAFASQVWTWAKRPMARWAARAAFARSPSSMQKAAASIEAQAEQASLDTRHVTMQQVEQAAQALLVAPAYSAARSAKEGPVVAHWQVEPVALNSRSAKKWEAVRA